jgi:hypothetical protein
MAKIKKNYTIVLPKRGKLSWEGNQAIIHIEKEISFKQSKKAVIVTSDFSILQKSESQVLSII